MAVAGKEASTGRNGGKSTINPNREGSLRGKKEVEPPSH